MIEYLQFVLGPQVINGLTIGVAIILVSLGLSIIFGLLDVVNMAHGEFYAMGAFVSMTLYALGLGFWAALIITPLLVMPIGALVERGLIRFVYHSPDRHTLTLLLTIGLSIILKDLYDVLYGPNTMKPDNPISGVTEIAGIIIPNYRLFLLVFGTVIITLTWFVLFRTRLGAVIRAAAHDKDMTASLGVPVRLIYSGAFAFGISLAALAGVLLAPIYSVFPTMGHDFILLAFTVVIVGGIGSFWGTVVAGLLLTQIESIASLYIAPNWGEPLIFSIMIAVLIVRPQGLFNWSR
ncbi:branched-chain amino acid ABC transporter permease [Castellaniella sp. S9]|uniref:branched-chain amino acid ABC transporter permease n=1 Tax=Castellaniella sp. S9 TaxID=2993652 RepID=UPI0022B455B3|nr:branched-chain amino acid ABC transporter permease [Castellaniella sp. S9]